MSEESIFNCKREAGGTQGDIVAGIKKKKKKKKQQCTRLSYSFMGLNFQMANAL